MLALKTVKAFCFVVLALGAVACGSAPGQDDAVTSGEELASCPPPVPAEIAVPPGNRLDFSLNATGVQIYECTATPTSFDWIFQAPKAKLFDNEGELEATHFAGPTWESVEDGSSVVGTKLAAVTINPTAIPELLLQATSHSGEGVMHPITYIQRLNTAAGLAPASGCDAAHAGAIANVPYTAQYFFYKASKVSKVSCH
jgi:hypothetical protein